MQVGGLGREPQLGSGAEPQPGFGAGAPTGCGAEPREENLRQIWLFDSRKRRAEHKQKLASFIRNGPTPANERALGAAPAAGRPRRCTSRHNVRRWLAWSVPWAAAPAARAAAPDRCRGLTPRATRSARRRRSASACGGAGCFGGGGGAGREASGEEPARPACPPARPQRAGQRDHGRADGHGCSRFAFDASQQRRRWWLLLQSQRVR